MEEFEDFDFDGGEFEGDIKLVPERQAFERAGLARGDEILKTLIGSGERIPGSLEEMNKRLYRLVIPDDEKFKAFVSIYFERFRETLGMSEGDFSSLMSKVGMLSKVKSLNPVGYVLGYYVTDREKNLSKDRFRRVEREILSNISEVKAPDVIRYGRLWSEKLF